MEEELVCEYGSAASVGLDEWEGMLGVEESEEEKELKRETEEFVKICSEAPNVKSRIEERREKKREERRE